LFDLSKKPISFILPPNFQLFPPSSLSLLPLHSTVPPSPPCAAYFLDCSPATYPSYGWLSLRVSFSRDEDPSKLAGPKPPPPAAEYPSEKLDPKALAGDFEFRLEDPVAMLPADELSLPL
jgi:hypothetical protein